MNSSMHCTNRLSVRKSFELAELPPEFHKLKFEQTDANFMRMIATPPRIFVTDDVNKAALTILHGIKIRYDRYASDNFWFVDAPTQLRETRRMYDATNNIEECLHNTKLLVMNRFDYVEDKDFAVLGNVLHSRRNRGRATVLVTNGRTVHNETIVSALMGGVRL